MTGWSGAARPVKGFRSGKAHNQKVGGNGDRGEHRRRRGILRVVMLLKGSCPRASRCARGWSASHRLERGYGGGGAGAFGTMRMVSDNGG